MSAARDGYREQPAGGPALRSDVVDVFVFRQAQAAHAGDAPTVAFLQLKRATEPLIDTWQPVMGHVEKGETSLVCAARELREETGLTSENAALLGAWALEQTHPFFVAAINCIVLSPRFAVEVSADWSPTLNEEHCAYRWVGASEIEAVFFWPGQKAVCREILAEIVNPAALARDQLRVVLP